SDTREIVGVAVSAAPGPDHSAKAMVRETPFQIPGDEQIEPAVIVVVEEPGAGAPARGSDARPCRHVSEGAVAVIVIQRIGAVSGHVDTFKTVIVEISD